MKNAIDHIPNIQFLPRGTDEEEEAEATFYENTVAMLGSRYMPFIDKIREINQYGWNPELEEGFNPIEHVSDDLVLYSNELAKATSMDHLRTLEYNLRRNIERRDVQGRASLLTSLGSEAFDLINYVPIPFVKGATILAKSAKTGAATGGLVAAQEAIRYPNDPLATKQEVFMNIGSAAAFGFLLQGAVSVPKTRRAKAMQDAEFEIKKLKETVTRKKDEVQTGTATKDLGIAESIFTDSWLYGAVTTPMKRILQDKTIPDSVKLTTLEIANDSGILLAANKAGKTLRPSVFQNSKLLEGEMVRAYDELLEIWGKSTGKGVTSKFDYMHKRSDFETWVTNVDAKVIKGQKGADDFETQAMNVLNTFYDEWEIRLKEEGLIGSNSFYEADIIKRETKISVYEDQLKRVKNKDDKAYIRRAISNQKAKIKEHKAVLESQTQTKNKKVLPKNETVFRPRYWDRDIIRKNRDEFERILFQWFTNNPVEIERNGKIVLSSTKDKDVTRRVKELTDKIINNTDDLDFDQGFFGLGKSKHMKHRAIDIPNSEVLKFIHTNPLQVMKAYVNRTGSRYEFSKQFGGRSIEDLLDDQEIEMIINKVPARKRFAVMKDMRHLYERVAGSVIHRDPSGWDYTAANVLRDLAQLGFLGKAGISTLTEPAKILMEHGLGSTMKGLFGVLEKTELKMGAREGRIAGEILEILMGSSHLRLVDDLGNNPLRSNVFDKAKNAFYLLNGLAPLTRIFKEFDSMVRCHTLIDYSVKLAKNKASPFEKEYLARYLIDEDIAKRIADNSKSKWQKGNSGLYIANSDAWTDELAKNRFRNALSSGIANTILMGTPADKPIITDGVAYIPMRIARKFGMKEDKQYRGYARIESGLLGLPFQFYSYSLAAVNKTMGAYAHGQVKSQFLGFAVAMGLGYMVLESRTPDFVELDDKDKFARAFDYSGIAPLYSDLIYTSIATSLALGGPNLTGGLIEAKYPQKPNTPDAIVGVLGAGPSIGLEYGRAFNDLIRGNFEQSAKTLDRILPFLGIPYIDYMSRVLPTAVAENYGNITIGRY